MKISRRIAKQSRTPAALSAAVLIVATLTGSLGCRSTAAPAVDPALARHASRAEQAFHDGYDERALERYRLALRRAWEIDDSVSIANTAFNLAACLAAMKQYEPARQALAEARAELVRSGESQVDAWLLEAKIARAQGRLAEAEYLANCVIEPMIRTSPECSAGRCGTLPRKHVQILGGAEHLVAHGAKHHDQQDQDDVCQSNVLSLALFRANLFLDQADVHAARAELYKAEQANSQRERSRHGHGLTEDPATRAEIAATQSRLLLATGHPLQAAWRLDDEVRWLKESEHYRELPMAMVAAGEAFLLADLPLQAAERFFRAARLLYGRGDLLAALAFLQRSIDLAVETADADLQLRGELLLGEIDRVNQKGSQPAEAAPSAEEHLDGDELPMPARQSPEDAPAIRSLLAPALRRSGD